MTAPTVLQIAHGFPPASGSGPIRALAFARYLPMYGWRSIVLTPGPAWASPMDPRLLLDVPSWVEVVRTASLEPRPRRHTERHTRRHTAGDASHTRHSGALKRHLGHLRRLPDAHVGWLPLAVAAGLRPARRADLLYSSSGPFTSHLVGLALHRLTGRPWVVELRDGWFRWNQAIFPDYPVWRAPVEARLEAAVMRGASRVVLVTERMARAFREQYADLPAEHFVVVPNGFDPTQLGSATGNVAGSTTATQLGSAAASAAGSLSRGALGGSVEQTFEVLHAGALYYGRPIGPVLTAAARLVDEDAEFAARFRLRLVGTLDATAQAEVAAARLGERVSLEGYLDHPATLAAERAADLLLLVANVTPGAEATVPGKLFEYLATGRPVLAVAPRESATADVLLRTGGGWLADGAEPGSVYQALRTAWDAHHSGTQAGPRAPDLARFDRRRLAGDLARLFDEVLRAPPTRGGH